VSCPEGFTAQRLTRFFALHRRESEEGSAWISLKGPSHQIRSAWKCYSCSYVTLDFQDLLKSPLIFFIGPLKLSSFATHTKHLLILFYFVRWTRLKLAVLYSNVHLPLSNGSESCSSYFTLPTLENIFCCLCKAESAPLAVFLKYLRHLPLSWETDRAKHSTNGKQGTQAVIMCNRFWLVTGLWKAASSNLSYWTMPTILEKVLLSFNCSYVPDFETVPQFENVLQFYLKRSLIVWTKENVIVLTRNKCLISCALTVLAETVVRLRLRLPPPAS
jgi:hypothetical protein